MPRLFVGNFDLEHRLACGDGTLPRNVARVNAELAPGWAAVGEPGGAVWTPLCAGVIAAVRPVGAASLGLVDSRSRGGLAWRLAVGWLAFPAAYLTFGILIAPFAIEAYSNRDGLIVIPPMGTILGVQAVRSVLFLLPTLAVIERWTGSRLSLWLALGWAHAALVGLSGLVMPSELFSPTLRVVHALEIAGDSFVYAGVVVAVLAGRRGER